MMTLGNRPIIIPILPMGKLRHGEVTCPQVTQLVKRGGVKEKGIEAGDTYACGGSTVRLRGG